MQNYCSMTESHSMPHKMEACTLGFLVTISRLRNNSKLFFGSTQKRVISETTETVGKRWPVCTHFVPFHQHKWFHDKILCLETFYIHFVSCCKKYLKKTLQLYICVDACYPPFFHHKWCFSRTDIGPSLIPFFLRASQVFWDLECFTSWLSPRLNSLLANATFQESFWPQAA